MNVGAVTTPVSESTHRQPQAAAESDMLNENYRPSVIQLYDYTVCVFVALDIQDAMFMRHIIICCLPRSTIFFHIFS